MNIDKTLYNGQSTVKRSDVKIAIAPPIKPCRKDKSRKGIYQGRNTQECCRISNFLTSQLNCARLSFAEAAKMQEYLHTIPGSVSALELIFYTDNNIQLVIDNDLMNDEYICGHLGINTSTVRLLRDDMFRYVREAKHESIFIDLQTE
ncbi:MAG: prolyl-tRNA synthetase associated domain-containing protein [Ruminococcus sp.]|nr:prolyl-tRNA synthetase associated domain-containing protein [Ruminococcus sp.]